MSKSTILVIVVLVLVAALFVGGLVVGGSQDDGKPSDPQAPGWIEGLGDLFGPPGEPLDFRTEVDYSPKSVRPARGAETLTIPEGETVTLTIRPSDEDHRSARLAWESGGRVKVDYVPRDADAGEDDEEAEDRFLEDGGKAVKLVVLEQGGTLSLVNVDDETPAVLRFR